MSLTGQELSADERHSEWVRIIERIVSEHINLGWSHYVFRVFREVFGANEWLLETGGFLVETIVEWYSTHAIMVVRRDMDRQRGTENLTNLLKDLQEHSHVLTRERFLQGWRDDEHLLKLGNDAFQKWNPIRSDDGPQADEISPDVIGADITELKATLDKARTYAERVAAHRTPADPELAITFAELHEAFRDLRRAIGKYYAMLTGKVMMSWEPVPQYNVLEAFTRPWITDDPDTMRALREAIGPEARDDA